MELISSEAILGICVLIGGVTMLFNKLGLVSFGRSNKGDSYKQQLVNHEARIVVTETRQSERVEVIKEIKEELKAFKLEIFPKINKTAEDVAEIKGILKGVSK